jgi:hypothetical protein
MSPLPKGQRTFDQASVGARLVALQIFEERSSQRLDGAICRLHDRSSSRSTAL